MKILIVDDIKDNLYMLETLLRGYGHEVESAADGVEALEKAGLEDFDMIISDILMPRMDGFQLCRSVKMNERLKKIAFIFYTSSYTAPSDEEFAMSLGAEKFIAKPAEPDVFMKIIAEVIKSHETGSLQAPREPIKDEGVYLKEYNERLVRKLEEKMLDLEEANKGLRESEEKYRDLIDNANDAVMVFGKTGTINFANPRFYEMTGYSIDEAEKLHVSKLIHPDDLDKCMGYFTRRLAGEKISRNYELRLLSKAGETIYIDNNSSIIEKEGRLVGILAIMRDITARKRAEEALRDASEKRKELESIVNKSPAVVFLWRAAEGWPVEYVSDNVRQFGYIPEDFYSGRMLFTNMVHPDDRERIATEITMYVKEGRNDFVQEYRIVTKSGEVRVLTDHTWVRRDADGGITHYQGIALDVTERKQAEEEKEKLQAQLLQAQKLEALGTLAGGIAHDFNNILTAILGYAGMVRDSIPDEGQTQADLDQVLKAGERAKNLVRQILAFSRHSEQECRPVQVHLIVKEALKLLRASIPMTIEIRQNINTEETTILADPTRIHQVLMNLCTNAYHAMRENGGVLDVQLETVEIDAGLVKKNPELHEGTYLRLTVSDTGHGMDQATLARIFEPYFSTKSKEEGTGLGLAVVHGIVTSLGGVISVQSNLGAGSTFHVYFPLAERHAVQEPSTSKPLLRGTERILYVDDELPIAHLGRRILESLGYDVTSRSSSVDALETFRTRPEKFDLVITDQTMPNMTGIKLARELMRIRPDIPVILYTGFDESITPELAKQSGIREFLMKPVAKDELASVIRKVLDQ
jgi:PAS domain S-box-containing protein